MNRKIMVIDGNNLFCRNFAAIGTTDASGEHNGALFGCIQSTLSIWKKLKSDRIFFIFDGYGGSVRRRKLYAEYKERKVGTKIGTKFLFESPEQQSQSFSTQMFMLKELLKKTPIDQLTIDYIEADDTIAFLASCNQDDEMIIVSTDRDYLQLVNGNLCKVYSPVKEKMYDEGLVFLDYNVYPINITLYRCFLGDSSDNIPGISGLGPKTLLKIFPFLSENKKYELNDCFEYCEQQIKLDKCNKWYQEILNNRNLFEINYKLMDLINLDISLTSSEPIIKSWHKPPKKINEVSIFQFRNYLMLNKFYELTKRMDIYTEMVSKLTIK